MLAGLVALAVITALVLIYGLPLYWQFQTTDLVKSFCRAVAARDTHAEYVLLSSPARHQMSEDDFASRMQMTELIECSPLTYADFNANHSVATLTVSLIYPDTAGTRQEKAVFTLSGEGGGWRIASIQSRNLTLP